MINPFVNSMITVNRDKWEEFKPIVKSLYPLLFHYFLSFNSLIHKGLTIPCHIHVVNTLDENRIAFGG